MVNLNVFVMTGEMHGAVGAIYACKMENKVFGCEDRPFTAD